MHKSTLYPSRKKKYSYYVQHPTIILQQKESYNLVGRITFSDSSFPLRQLYIFDPTAQAPSLRI